MAKMLSRYCLVGFVFHSDTRVANDSSTFPSTAMTANWSRKPAMTIIAGFPMRFLHGKVRDDVFRFTEWNVQTRNQSGLHGTSLEVFMAQGVQIDSCSG